MNRINLIGPSENHPGRLFDPSYRFNHSCVLTFTVDLLFYEQTLLRHFLTSGSTNNILIADRNQLLKAQNSQYRFLSRDSSSYIFHGATTGHIFHPKSFLFVGDEEIRLFFGSGNLTVSGLSANQELYHELSSNNEAHRQAIWEFLQYIRQLTDLENLDTTTQDRLDRMLLAASTVQKRYEVLPESPVHFIHNLEKSLMDQVKDFIPTCDKMTVISPFFDHDFKAVHMLMSAFTSDISVFFQPTYTNFNAANYSGQFPIYHHNIDPRSLHAKMYIFEHDDELSLLYGSPNCTFPALFSKASTDNTEIALLLQHVPRQNKDYYLPDDKKAVTADQIIPMQNQVPEDVRYLLKSARYTKESFFEIGLAKNIDNPGKLVFYLNGQVLKDIRHTYNPDTNILTFSYLPRDNRLYWLSGSFEGAMTNTVLVLNQQKEITKLENNETRLLNRLNGHLEIDSMEYIAFSRSLDPFIEIQTAIENDYSIQEEADATDEKEAVESDIVKQSKDFYVHVKSITWEGAEYVTPKQYKSFVFDLFDSVSKFLKVHNDTGSPSARNESDSSEGSQGVSKQFNIIKSYLDKVMAHLEELATVFNTTKDSPMGVLTFRDYYRDVVSYIPYCDQLSVGVKVRLPMGDSYQISWTQEELFRVLPLMVKIITAFWRNALAHKNFLLERIPKEYFLRFFIISINNLIVLDFLQRNMLLRNAMSLNHSNTDFLFANAVSVMSQVVADFQIGTDASLIHDDITGRLFEGILKKYHLDISMAENADKFVSLLSKNNLSDDKKSFFTQFMSKRQVNPQLGLNEVLS